LVKLTHLVSLEAIYVNGTFDVIPRLGAKKMTRQRFLVEKILPDGLGKDAIVPYQFSLESKIVIRDAQSTLDASLPTSPMEFDFGTLKGMDEELDDLAGILESELPHEPTLIVGPSGTGKTSVLKALADGKWSAFRITASTVSSSDSKIRAILSALFSEARDSLPAIVLIDNLDRLVPRDASAALANAIGEEIQNKLNRSVCIVASAKRQLDLHEAFTWVFPNVIELPVPTAAARKDILAVHCESASGELLEHVSLRTHAFVPGDIWRLCGAAKQAARKRRDKAHPRLTSADARPKVQILEEDFAVALRSVRPSAMGEIFLDVPNVRWSDIGGSEHLKDELRRATSFIFEVSESSSFCAC
jgi:AAA family ATPase